MSDPPLLRVCRSALFVLLAAAAPPAAGEPIEGEESGEAAGGDESAASATAGEEAPPYETVIHAGEEGPEAGRGRAATRVTRRDIQERLPRSAPDALRYEPGVFVQQTAAGQASAFVRGLTGQQTVLLFDGIRLNNSTWRQGPNQYFFTLDAATIREIDVVRGGSSVRYGSDAVGGVIDARPLEAPLWSDLEGPNAWPRSDFRAATADEEISERFQLEWQWDRVGFIGGWGWRTVGLQRSGGAVIGPDGDIPGVPRFAEGSLEYCREHPEECRTQLGTGFDEMTFDARGAADLGSGGRVVGGLYGYRQYDAPRTDQCPPDSARYDECLVYDEQFRTLAYLSWRGDPWTGVAEDARLTVSYQRQHERRSLHRPASHVLLGGVDDVDTWGLAGHAATPAIGLADGLDLAVRYGADVYGDGVESTAWVSFTDTGQTVISSRGQYLDGSTYVTGGVFVEPELAVADRVTLSLGGRLAAVGARAPADPASGSSAVDAAWWTPVGRAGAAWSATDWLALRLNVDHAFRAPNLDDLTSRQMTGPGFQFENPGLAPEQALTIEGGFQVRLPWLKADAWAFWTPMWDAMARRPREADDCPPAGSSTGDACRAAWNRFQLVNLDGRADVAGVELSALVELPLDLSLRATLAWTRGEGPNPAERPADPAVPYEETVPLSRIPPLNGTVELRWTSDLGFWAGAGLRWAATQDRLAIQDLSDSRIPPGGTPGFAALDLRAGWRWRRNLVLGVVLENVWDEAYRYHGSSVNAPGRGLIVNLEVGL